MLEDKSKALKEIIKQLHSGTPPSDVKERFSKILETVTPQEIAKIEQQLVVEGVPREELQKLCDIHLAVFSEQLDKTTVQIQSWHPIKILMEEHKSILSLLENYGRLFDIVKKAEKLTQVEDEISKLNSIAEDFNDSEKHYLREENVIFPLLEKHGITEPPAIMWMEHDKIRNAKKEFQELVKKIKEQDFQIFKEKIDKNFEAMNTIIPNHFYKENNILFPTALQLITKEEWEEALTVFNEIGYCRFTPLPTVAPEIREEKIKEVSLDKIKFETGSLTIEEVEAILNSLPIDITFVDTEDKVKFFNKSERRIFIRTKAVIGRKVQQCHPQKSVHIVNKILDSFKDGKRDVAEFWIEMGGRLIYIRYFPVRGKVGKYLGTIEVTQDVTEIKKLVGERRLLNWE
ncbi:MAG: DUF438 domain-containing protein [Nitrososphaeria archaeon]